MNGPSPTWRSRGPADFSLTDHVPMRLPASGFPPLPRDKSACRLPAVLPVQPHSPTYPQWAVRQYLRKWNHLRDVYDRRPFAHWRPDSATAVSTTSFRTVPVGLLNFTNIRYLQVPLFLVASVDPERWHPDEAALVFSKWLHFLNLANGSICTS